MNAASNKANFKAIIFIFLMMIMSALCDSVRGVFIPVFKSEFNISNTAIGLMLTVCSLGYIVCTYIGGILCEKLGQKKVYVMGFVFVISSLLLLSASYSFKVLLIGMFFVNVGQSLIGISTNTLVPVLFMSFQAILMNLTHFCYGLGSSIAQRFAGVMLYKGLSWRSLYMFIAIYASILFICFLFVKIPQPKKVRSTNESRNTNIFKNKLVYLYIIGLGFYIFSEAGTNNWLINFMTKSYNYNESRSSLYLSLFFALFTIGRLLGGFVVEKTGYLNTVIVSLIIAFGLYTIGLTMGERGMTIVSLAGLFYAVTFPTVILTISKVFKQNSAYATGIILTFASSTNMIMNLLLGYLNDKIGVSKAFYIIPLSLIISIIFIVLIYRNTKSELIRSRG